MTKTPETVQDATPNDDFRTFYGIKGAFKRTLRLQNTGDLFCCSEEDWKKANCCKWNLTAEGRVVNTAGYFFEDYVGIKTPRKQVVTDFLDFSRYNYEELSEK